MAGPPSAASGAVLVVGATGRLPVEVVQALLTRGKNVRVLIPPAADRRKFDALGVQTVGLGMLNKAALTEAMSGVDAVITATPELLDGDEQERSGIAAGHANLAGAAKAAGVRRFVFTSVLGCDRAPSLPALWNRKLAEDLLDRLGMPFVALRPGMFIDDQIGALNKDSAGTPAIRWLGDPDARLTFVLISDYAGYLADAVDAEVVNGERIDIGWTRPVSVNEFAKIGARYPGGRLKVRATPRRRVSGFGKLVGRWLPAVRELAAVAEWFDSGQYVADTRRQSAVFGAVPTPENAIARFTAQRRSAGGHAE